MPKIVTKAFLNLQNTFRLIDWNFVFFFVCLHYTYSNSASDFKCGVTYQWIQLFLKTFSFLNGHCVITKWSLPLVVIKDEWLWRKFQCSCGRSNNIVGTRLQFEIIQSFCFKLCPNMVLIVLKNETSLTKGHVFLASVIQHARVHLGVFCCQEGWKKINNVR